MINESAPINLRKEVEDLLQCIIQGDPHASIHLARVIEADTKGTLQPFAEALAARLCDHIDRYAELGVTNSHETLEDEVYHLIQIAAIDWDGRPRKGRPGEEF